MNTHPKAPTTTTRGWTKPLMVAIPLFAFFVFVFLNRQFTRPDVSFVPKHVKLGRGIVLVSDKAGHRTLTECTTAVWETNYQKNLPTYQAEILAKGYKQISGAGDLKVAQIFENGKGNRLQIRPLNGITPPGSKENGRYVELLFMHEEERAVQSNVKLYMAWMNFH